MSKRKKNNPQRVSDEKRHCLSWNMLDGPTPSGSLDIIADNDPDFLKEIHNSKNNVENKTKSIQGENELKIINVLNLDVEEVFHQYLDNCLFYFSVFEYDQISQKHSDFSFEIGHFHVCLTTESSICKLPEQLPQTNEFWLYISETPGQSLIYFEMGGHDENNPDKDQDKTVLFWCVQVDLPIQALEAFQFKKFFQVVIKSYDSHRHLIEMVVYGNKNLISGHQMPSEPVRPKNIHKALQPVMEHFFNIASPSYAGLMYTKKHDIEGLYQTVKEQHSQREITPYINVQHESLKPVLRPYQKQAVRWMLYKENVCGTESTAEKASLPLHCLYEEISTQDGIVLYYNKYVGSLVQQKFLSLENPPGGILAEEMGLGKTVEVLACILCHPRKDIQLADRLPLLPELEALNPKPSDRSQDSRSYLVDSEDTKSVDFDSVVMEINDICSVKSAEIKAEESSDDKNVRLEDRRDLESEHDEVHADASVKGQVQDQVHTDISADCQDSAVLLIDVTNIADVNSANNLKNCNISTSGFNCDKNSLTDKTNDKITENDNIDVMGNAAKNDINSKIREANEQLSETDEQSSETGEKMQHINSNNSQKLSDSSEIVFDGNVSGTCEPTFSIDTSLCAEDLSMEWETSKDGVDEEELESLEADSDKQKVSSRKKRKSKKRKWTSVKPSRRRKSIEKSKSQGKSTNKEAKNKLKMPSRFVQIVEESAFTPKNMFDVSEQVKPKTFFECICGQKDQLNRSRKKKKHIVQCAKCGLYQHAECVNYNLNDPYRGEFKCPHCHVSSPPVVSGATLIISPSAICHQWVDEILKHIKQESIKVFVYTGVNKQGFIQPMTLAQQDIVITTYETLRKEIDYVDLPHSNSENGRKFRHPKRFMAIPSPIIAVEWWRICLDEAQMVECTTTKTAAMALRLSTVNRWCVTGTPIQKSIEDLYGLLVFLGVDPYWVQQWWNKLLHEPFCYGIHQPLYDAVTKVLWRTAKKDVIDQINLPEQTEHLHWLTFSPVEEHFYRRQYQNSINDAMKRLSKWTDVSTKLSSLDKHTMSLLLYPLLRLRQACCHPQAVRGEFIPIQKTTMTMEELLESLTKKAKTECEEAHRQLVGALNGLAALHIIKDEYVDAVENYREVLRSVEEHKKELRTDDLQQLHAMYNLHEIITSKPKGVSPTLRDHLLKEQCKELKEKYMNKAEMNVTAAQDQLIPVQQHIRELKAEFSGGEEWWVDTIELVAMRGIDEPLIEHIKDDLDKHFNHQHVAMSETFNTLDGLELSIYQRLEALESAHEKLVKAIRMLSVQYMCEDVINKTVECCLRPVGEISKSCPFCHADKLFEEYESKLFLFDEKGVTMSTDGDVAPVSRTRMQVATKRQGTWADSELEKCLKSVLNFAKIHIVGQELVEAGNIHIKLIETLKKEFKPLRNVWMYLREEVSAVDELDMAKTRLRLRLPDEEKPDTPQTNILEPCEVDHHVMRMISERTIGKNELRKKLGQLLYLKNLAKTQGENDIETGLSQECPICQREMGAEWSVLHCGHCYCLDCMHIMVERYSFGGHNSVVKCAVCRQKTRRSDISFVSTKKAIDLKNGDDFTVKGSHSTKVEGIVRCLMKIKRDDPNAKALVFSSWTDVLNVIARALDDNNITYKTLYTGGKFQQHLAAFKEETDITALLLPIHSGANGLNLIEATYVLMVEPVLNPAQELQAIGRVHRIGQTHQTEVHRFLVRGTIEQKMYSMLKSIEESPSSHDTEENRLTIGDLTSLLSEEREGTEDLADEIDIEELSEGTVTEATGNTSIEQDTTVVQSVSGCDSSSVWMEQCDIGEDVTVSVSGTRCYSAGTNDSTNNSEGTTVLGLMNVDSEEGINLDETRNDVSGGQTDSNKVRGDDSVTISSSSSVSQSPDIESTSSLDTEDYVTPSCSWDYPSPDGCKQ